MIIEKDGYEKKQLTVYGSPNGWYIGGNFVFGGLIGYLIVDPLTGAMWTLTPDRITAELAQKTTLTKTGNGLVIMNKEDVPMELRGDMKPIPNSQKQEQEEIVEGKGVE